MRRRSTALLSLLLFAAVLAAPVRSVRAQAPSAPSAEGDAPVERQAEAVATLFRENPEPEGGYEALFAPGFLSQVPEAQLTGIFAQYFSQYGAVTEVQPREIGSRTRGTFYFIFEEGYRVPATLAVGEAPPHHVVGFYIGVAEPVAQAGSLAEVTEELAALPGEVSFLLAEIEEDGMLEPLAAHRASEPEGIGSAFKLYVLGALVRQIEAGQRSWSDVVRLEEAARSLPSGFLQTWPAGAPLTLHTLATLMISRSDNTATDLLLRTLGRRSVEAAQAAMGHARPTLNEPFFTTRELFVLKNDSTLADRYLAADEAGRRALLEGEVAAVAREDILPFATPTRIETLEWFASARDLARAMAWFRRGTEARDTEARTAAREILSVNPGLGFDEEAWTYVGFKGGSEPGVVNTTFLLHAADGTWYALSASWNNPEAAVDQARFFSLVKQAVRQVE